MKITKRQLKRIIKEEKAKLVKEKLNETHSMDSVRELSSIIDSIDEIANALYSALRPSMRSPEPELAKDLEMQVERLANLHDKLERSLQDSSFRKVVDRQPTDADGYT